MAKKPTDPDDDKPTAPPPTDPLVHPDPAGKMRSYAPGYGPGPDGEAVEIAPESKDNG